MLFLSRVASAAAFLSCAALLVAGTTPGFAQEVSHTPIATINAIAVPQVPMTPSAVEPAPAPAPAAQVRPAVLQVQPLPQDAVVTADVREDDEDFGSLSEAVAAQDAALDDREMRCLAAGIYFESKSEPLAGQLAVAQTILNRTKSGRFPKSVCGVLTQKGQFSFVRGGAVPTAEGRKGWDVAVAVAKVAVRDLWESDADDALFFHARRVSPGWRMQKVAAIGNHVFYR